MSVCAHRPDDGGLFKPCAPCACSQEVRDELNDDSKET